MSTNGYRELVKKASINLQMGFKRAVFAGIVALATLVLAFFQWRYDLMIMAALLGFIAWQNYSAYSYSKNLFEALDELNKQYDKLEELPGQD